MNAIDLGLQLPGQPCPRCGQPGWRGAFGAPVDGRLADLVWSLCGHSDLGCWGAWCHLFEERFGMRYTRLDDATLGTDAVWVLWDEFLEDR